MICLKKQKETICKLIASQSIYSPHLWDLPSDTFNPKVITHGSL